MALPSSGPLSLNDIHQELVNGGLIGPSYPYALKDMSVVAGFGTPTSPASISEFYGYSSASLSYYFTLSGFAGTSGYMYVYKNKSLVVNVSSNGASGTISASSGDGFDVEVVNSGFAFSMCVARIFYPAVYAIPQAEVVAPGYAAASYSFTYDGSNATITGNSYNY
jgi:hypothetical protein